MKDEVVFQIYSSSFVGGEIHFNLHTLAFSSGGTRKTLVCGSNSAEWKK
jgi:hypothetical protein